MGSVRETIGGQVFIGSIDSDAHRPDGSTALGRGLGVLDRANLSYTARFPDPVGTVHLTPEQIHTLATTHENSDGPTGRTAVLMGMLNPALSAEDRRAAARLILAQIDQFDSASARTSVAHHRADRAHPNRELEVTFEPAVGDRVSQVHARFSDGPATSVSRSVDAPRTDTGATVRGGRTDETAPDPGRAVLDFARAASRREAPVELWLGRSHSASFDREAWTSITGAMDAARRGGRDVAEAGRNAIFEELRHQFGTVRDEAALREVAGIVFDQLARGGTTVPDAIQIGDPNAGASEAPPPSDSVPAADPASTADPARAPDPVSTADPVRTAEPPASAPITLSEEDRTAMRDAVGQLGTAVTFGRISSAEADRVRTAAAAVDRSPTPENLRALDRELARLQEAHPDLSSNIQPGRDRLARLLAGH